MKISHLIVLLMLSGIMQATYADLNNGIYAYLKGDYETAYHTMVSLAKTSEDIIAQYYLGMMYLKGQGTEKNYKLAGEWLRKASENGLPAAMYNLAKLYTEGKGVPKDLEFAYIWYNVAASHEHQKSIDSINGVRTKLSDEELNSANQLVPDYIRQYGPQPIKQQKEEEEDKP